MFIQFIVDCCRVFFFIIAPMMIVAMIPFYLVCKRDNKKIQAALEQRRQQRLRVVSAPTETAATKEPAA